MKSDTKDALIILIGMVASMIVPLIVWGMTLVPGR